MKATWRKPFPKQAKQPRPIHAQKVRSFKAPYKRHKFDWRELVEQ